jgi:hypothetical protein
VFDMPCRQNAAHEHGLIPTLTTCWQHATSAFLLPPLCRQLRTGSVVSWSMTSWDQIFAPSSIAGDPWSIYGMYTYSAYSSAGVAPQKHINDHLPMTKRMRSDLDSCVHPVPQHPQSFPTSIAMKLERQIAMADTDDSSLLNAPPPSNTDFDDLPPMRLEENEKTCESEISTMSFGTAQETIRNA